MPLSATACSGTFIPGWRTKVVRRIYMAVDDVPEGFLEYGRPHLAFEADAALRPIGGAHFCNCHNRFC